MKGSTTKDSATDSYGSLSVSGFETSPPVGHGSPIGSVPQYTGSQSRSGRGMACAFATPAYAPPVVSAIGGSQFRSLAGRSKWTFSLNWCFHSLAEWNYSIWICSCLCVLCLYWWRVQLNGLVILPLHVYYWMSYIAMVDREPRRESCSPIHVGQF